MQLNAPFALANPDGKSSISAGTLSPLIGAGFMVTIQFGILAAARRSLAAAKKARGEAPELSVAEGALSSECSAPHFGPEQRRRTLRYRKVYCAYRDSLQQSTMLVSFAVAGCGSIAGVASALVSGPVEHVRIRLQLQGPRAPPTIATVAVEAPAAAASAVSSGTRAFSTVAAAAAPVEYGGSVDAFRSIYSQHGLRGVFRGLPATGLREAVGCGMYFGVYEVAKRGFAESVGGVDNLGIHHFLMAGGLSGVLAWIPSYPIDIIKSKIQADVLTGQRRYPGVSIIRDLALEAGPAVLLSPPPPAALCT